MPKTSSNDRINAAFEEIGEALNNPKLREGFLNENKENEIINELVEMFDQKAHNLIVEKANKSNVDHTSNKNKILHIPARVNHSSVPVTDTDRRQRVNHSSVPVTDNHKSPRVNQNPEKIPHAPAPKCERKPAEMTIRSPLSHFPNGTVIYKLFNKEY